MEAIRKLSFLQVRGTGGDPRRRGRDRAGPVPRLIWVGLGAQLVGVATQAAFHVGGDAVAPLLTETRTSVIDHVMSNLGVACLAWQTGRWVRSGAGWTTPARRTMVCGTAAQVVGALIDAVGHLRGGEQPLGFAAIGVGYVLVAGGALGSLRAKRSDRPLHSQPAHDDLGISGSVRR